MNETNDRPTDGLTKGQSQTSRQSVSQTVRQSDMQMLNTTWKDLNRTIGDTEIKVDRKTVDQN